LVPSTDIVRYKPPDRARAGARVHDHERGDTARGAFDDEDG